MSFLSRAKQRRLHGAVGQNRQAEEPIGRIDENQEHQVPSITRDLAVRFLIAAMIGGAVPAAAQQPGAAPNPDLERGRMLFTTGYKCFACHGYDAQTGERRLIPMNYTQEGFTTFVQNSPLPQMPAYADMSARDLGDVYAYIKSIPVDAPNVESVPLLQDLLNRKLEALAD
jgi:mono/diheme cytochrome c family protein